MKNMLPRLYYTLWSPPARACMVTAKLIGLDLDLKFVDFPKREHFSEEFLKLNPQHTIPVLVDDGKPIWDSHAIMIYMMTKYSKDNSLYPEDAITRARVNQRLFFDTGILFPALKEFANRIVYSGETDYHPTLFERAQAAYDFLETFLENDYVVGNDMTIGDISIYTTVITLGKAVPIEKEKYPRINAWMKRMEKLPDDKEINELGAEQWFNRITTALENNRLNAKKN